MAACWSPPAAIVRAVSSAEEGMSASTTRRCDGGGGGFAAAYNEGRVLSFKRMRRVGRSMSLAFPSGGKMPVVQREQGAR